MTILRIDIETYSSADLKKCGVHKYVEAPDFGILLFGYAFDQDPVQVIDLMSEPLPPEITDALLDPAVVKTAFNAAFEITCISRHLRRPLDVTQWRCTSVHALYLGMPGNLGEVGKVVGLSEDQQKLGTGWALIRYFSLPCRPTKVNGGRTRNLPQHDPDKWKLFIEYCKRDVETERAIAERLAKFPAPDLEWQLWQLDQRMNTMGVLLDRDLVEAAIELDTQYKARLVDEAVAITGLSNPNSRGELIDWLEEEEQIEIETLTKKDVPKLLESVEQDHVRRVLQIRQQLAKTSVTKYYAMANAMCGDDRLRGLLQFYGANRTGRWAGRLVQVQNLPKNALKDLNLARELVKARRLEDVELLFGNVPDTLSQLIRTAFVARPDHQLIVVDFSAIEARVIAWMANCAWRMDVFATHGKIYEASAEQMFKLPAGSVGKKSPYRQKGKIAELALGYQGGAGALITMGALDMGLTEDELEPIKTAWREANPEIVKLWWACQDAAMVAVANRTTMAVPIAAGRAQLVFEYKSGFLFVWLPSGRRLAYVKPSIELDEKFGREVVTYEGVEQKTRRWSRVKSYGGKWVENAVQAIARDCLREAMLKLDAAGFAQLMTVHDEIVIEHPASQAELGLQQVEAIMAEPILWAPGLLLRGDGFVTDYYRKDD